MAAEPSVVANGELVCERDQEFDAWDRVQQNGGAKPEVCVVNQGADVCGYRNRSSS